jgi:ubiquinone/menaquinone biosynthesis C-methylase UbiE
MADNLRMHFYRWKNRNKNNQFRIANPDFSLPADDIMYETFKLDYQKYFDSGAATAKWLLELYKKQTHSLPEKVLDWGCGPGRVVRHLPDLLPEKYLVIGSDFNSATISWCQENIPDISFLNNKLDPPLELRENQIDFAYAISVFTHLSSLRHKTWIKDIFRVLAPSGIFIFSTQGEIFRNILTYKEKIVFDQGALVVRSADQEGRRTFSAFHPTAYIRSILTDFEIVEHIKGTLKNGQPQQDLWIVKKK